MIAWSAPGHALVEALVLALLLGVAARNLPRWPAPFAARPVLELGVGLLGITG